jgi:hypothetical protein
MKEGYLCLATWLSLYIPANLPLSHDAEFIYVSNSNNGNDSVLSTQSGLGFLCSILPLLQMDLNYCGSCSSVRSMGLEPEHLGLHSGSAT